MSPWLPPVVGLAAALGAGAALALSLPGAPPTLLLPFLAPLPIVLWRRPVPALALAAAAAAGGLLAATSVRHDAHHCLRGLEEGRRLEITGRVVAGSGTGLHTLRVERGLPGGCRVGVRVIGMPEATPPGAPVEVTGVWRRGGGRERMRPEATGTLRVEEGEVRPGRAGGPPVREGAALRLRRLYPRRWPLAEALVLARKEGLDPALRDAFARSGTAHLLAISGFHVGVVAGLLLGVLRALRLDRRRAAVWAAAGVWAYVGAIGFPDAASRAATIVTVVALGRLRARPPAYAGALAAAFLLLILLDPPSLRRPGLQLSFAGAAGLVGLAGPIRRFLSGGRGTAGWRRWARRIPAGVTGAVAAGVAATAATLPLVAWHFGRVSAVGVPATLTAGPIVTLALPGILFSLGADLLHPALGAFVAGGTDALLWLLAAVVERWGALRFASFPVPRPWVLGGGAGLLAALLLPRPPEGSGRRGTRVTWLAAAVLVGWLLWPPAAELQRRGALEIHFLDVGQGDAAAIRFPGGRWILVDAGPRTPRFDAGERIVVPYLLRRGATRLGALVLTHPDLDHIGGAAAVLESIAVDAVVDPGRAAAKDPYVDLLSRAAERGVGWWRGGEGERWTMGGVEIEVLHPPESTGGGGEEADANETSVVLRLRHGAFTVLLLGDASVRVERRLLPHLAGDPVEVLKVGHHGSRTSTDPALLDVARPAVAVISAGRRNRYGHPHAEVVDRLQGRARLLRTDVHGTVRVRGWRDGRYEIRVQREESGRRGTILAR